MNSFLFGNSYLGQAILGHQFGSTGKHLLLLGGVHGDELEGIFIAKRLLNVLSEKFPYSFQLTLVPEFNPDGSLKQQRKNARGVDLNRNLPTQDWTSEVAKEKYYPGTEPGSEPENQALLRFLANNKVDFIISLHSFERYLLNTNGDCREVAEIIHRETAYPIEETMGYPTPGCLGTLTGFEMNIPTLTYELHRGEDLEKLAQLHIPAFHKVFQFFSGGKNV